MIYDQPVGTNSKGVILTIGIDASGNRTELTVPLFTGSDGLTPATFCEDAVSSFNGIGLANLTVLLSSESFVSFVAAEGAIDGFVPFRIDFVDTDWPGSDATPALPSTTGILCVWYALTADLPPGTRMRSGKNTIPGVSRVNWEGSGFSDAFKAAVLVFVDQLGEGFASTENPSESWYRPCSFGGTRVPGSAVIRAVTGEVRGYVGTERRRQLPH